MKKINKWFLFFLAVLLALPICLGCVVFLGPPQYDETYLGELQEKKERLERITEKKIIVVGGSSVAFGIYSDVMEDQLEMPVVNWGLYAPLGSRTMLEACFDEIGEGDIVVFSPEQNRETLSLSFQAREVWQAMEGDYSLLRIFREEESKQLLGAFPEFAISKWKYMIYGKPQISGIYQKSSFNEYGDIASSERSGNCMAEGYDATQMIDLSFFPKEDFLEYLNDYAKRVEEKGAVFYFRFCPMNQQALLGEERLDDWYLQLDQATDFTILGNPHRSVMESGWFYDTNFHLNEAGTLVNTYYFIRDLKVEMRDTSPTELALPAMPESLYTERSEAQSEIQTDGDCFLYEENGEYLLIIGVNQQGAEREELTVPTMYEGRKVTGVAAGSFEGCTKLRTVHIYGGVSLYDGCFAGCETLDSILLYGEPSDITVGFQLLEGSEALLYTEDADAYRLNYSWGMYADRIRNRE